MKALPFPVLILLSLLLAPGPVSRAQDNVTVPKSRLEELERKERELERLKGDLNKTKDENTQLKQEKAKGEAKAATAPAAEPVVVHTSPPMASLPPLKPGESVESLDLANYYRADSQAADHRFLRQKLTLRGEIVGFDKPLFVRNYKVLLKTADRDTRVICDFLPPEKSNAVFTSDHGNQLVALMGEKRVLLARVGDQAVVKGECKGLHGTEIRMSCWELALMK